ncbi:MAG TPA: DUF885 family protein [Pyrinomonadaceae bacterium]|nr:DUF885 family protein [Pyrinomonadaceae bacterium]
MRKRIQFISGLAVLVALVNSSLVALPVRTRAISNTSAAADTPANEVRHLIESYNADRGNLNRTYSDALSPARRIRFQEFFAQWRDNLAKVNFQSLTPDGRVDYLLFKNHLNHELRQLDEQAKQWTESEPLIPFAKTVFELDDTRRRMDSVDAPKAAAQLTAMIKQVDSMRRTLGAGPGSRSEEGADSKPNPDGEAKSKQAEPIKVKKHVANRTVATIASLRNTLRAWFDYYNGYDPIFSWWVSEPYKSADQALQAYATFMSEKVAGVRFGDATDGRGGAGPEGDRGPRGPQAGRSANARPGDSSDIVGDPIGHDALMVELASEMIPYTPEELIVIANKELTWCETEMKKASRDLGYGDDWRKALEHVKGLYVDPGKQPELIRNLAVEAINFLDQRDLVTIPPLARETWRMQMMTPERQLVSPFFLGGETILVSYPTNTMSHEQKMMSMRGNNIHFARATVHHELIPGHHLQGFMNSRYKPYRSPFRTPFWGEGWALYWELLLWDLGFPKTPENRIGMLFWRMHRCARIIFSLGFHLGQMTPKQCIDFLVQRVGHEPDNATAEVRRSFNGSYAPLYQVAYLLGGLQIYSLHKELVDSKKMTNRAFHDAILQENSIPIEMVRAILTKQKLTSDYTSNWKFYGLQ